MAPSTLPSVLAALGAEAASAEPDADLLARYVAGRDDAAFAALVRRYARLVWRVARTRCRTETTAEDVFQATFVVLARKASSVRSGGALPGWLHRTAHRLAVKAARGERPPVPLPTDTPVSADPLDALTARELLAAVDDEVARLSDAERSALVLCGVEDQSVDEAAGRLGWTPASVKGRLRRARAKLRARLAARGLTLPAVALGLVGGPTAGAVQAAARAATGGPVRPAVTPLIVEGLRMNGAITKAVVGVTLLGGLLLAGGWGGGSGPNPQATAAPVPKVAPEEGGLLWTFHCKTGELTAYTPAGEKAKTLTLQDGYRLRGMTPDGSKLVFVGRGGRLADAADLNPGLSIHLRDINDRSEGVDTGIAYHHMDQFVWSPDGKKVVRVAFPPGRLPQGLPLVTNSVIDLETKTETPIPLGDDHEQVLNWSPDGTWLFTTRYTKTVQHGKVTYFQTEKRRYDLKASTSRPVDTKWQLGPVALSPDGRSLFGCGTEPDTVGPDMRHLMVRADVATGKSAEVARHEDQSFASPHWSPGGTRVAYLWHKRADKGEAFLAITDPDGKNAKTVTIPTPGDTANELAFFGWFPAEQRIAAPVPKAQNDVGLLWTWDAKTATLTAFHEDGTKERQLALKAERNFQAFGHDGESLLFLAKNGQLTDEKGGLTLHIGTTTNLAEAIDTGIRFEPPGHYFLTRDKKRVVRYEFMPGDWRAVKRQPIRLRHTIFDLKDNKETVIDLPEGVQIVDETVDGKEWIGLKYNDDPKLFGDQYVRIPVAGGKPVPIFDGYQFPSFRPSPDGQSYLGIGVPLPPKDGVKGFNLYHLNPVTGQATKLEQFSDTGARNLHWSPEGKRYAVKKHDDADIFVGDIAGKNHRKLFTIPEAGKDTVLMGWFPKPKQKIDAPPPKAAVVRTLELGGEKVEFVRVPAGKFTMGSAGSDQEADGSERPQHVVTFTKDLWVAKHPVTRGQFAAFVTATGYKTEAEADGKGGEGFNGKALRPGVDFTWKNTGWEQADAHPVVNVSWTDAAKFCEWAAKEAKVPVRLPTEAEYEYAARGGTRTVYLSGDEATSLEGYANVADASAKGKLGMGWAVPFDDGEAFTSPVGKYRANGFGLYDMTGNVWSWCGDWADAKLYRRGDVTDPVANADGAQKNRALRGGSWYDPAKNCRAATRSWAAPDARLYNIGFRLVFSPDSLDGRKGGAVSNKDEAKKADEPAWTAEFRKAYGLMDGELVKRIAPPYPDCRTDYFRSVQEWQRKRPPTDAELQFAVNNFTVFNWKDNAPSAGWQTHTEPDRGVSLQFVLGTVLEIPRTRLESDQTTLDRKVTGDFVVRVGADREKMAAQLEAILRKELELPVKFSFMEVEEEVFVLSGKYAAKPLEDRKANEIEVYAARLIDRNVGGGGSGAFREMIDAVERHTGRPILLDTIDGLPKGVQWHFNFSNPPNVRVEAQERDTATLLGTLAEQTGLTVKEEKRKLRKLVIEFAALKQ